MKASLLKKKTLFLQEKIKIYLKFSNQWFSDTPERSLLEAYQAAQVIKNIETEHFSGNKISPESGNYSESVMSYWQVQLEKTLILIKLRLIEFQLSNSFLNRFQAEHLEKLQFIDEVIDKYRQKDNKQEKIIFEDMTSSSQALPVNPKKVSQELDIPRKNDTNVESAFNKTGLFPRSIGRTFNRIQADFSPQAEENFVSNFRNSQNRTRIAVKFLLMLVIVPMLTQHFSQPLINIIVEKMRSESPNTIFLNHEMEEEAFRELRSYEKRLQFEKFIFQAPEIAPEVIEEKVKHRANEIAKEFQEKSNNAISNIFADLLSLISFALVIVTSKREIVVVKAFMDDIIYGLSDSAKAFLIILFTDTFVGFHSPHGWEVILDSLAEHLGLPANQSFISLFIATFPVILDTIFKYWIFRYLSRLSPSALATLKEINE
ncbi:proton extrusion protein PcxA [Scytonema sp. NUACC21]